MLCLSSRSSGDGEGDWFGAAGPFPPGQAKTYPTFSSSRLAGVSGTSAISPTIIASSLANCRRRHCGDCAAGRNAPEGAFVPKYEIAAEERPKLKDQTSTCEETMRSLLLAFALAWFVPSAGAQQPPLYEQSGDFVATGFHFEDGSSLPQVTLHYATLGVPRCGGKGHFTNVVLLLHGATDTGRAFLTAAMRRELFGPGQPLDASRYFIIIPDGLGRGGSSKPSDGLRAKFPQYGYNDVVQAQYLLVTRGLGIDHLRLVLGTSMG